MSSSDGSHDIWQHYKRDGEEAANEKANISKTGS